MKKHKKQKFHQNKPHYDKKTKNFEVENEENQKVLNNLAKEEQKVNIDVDFDQESDSINIDKSDQSENSNQEEQEEDQEKIQVYMIDFQQCDTKRCSGSKLKKHKKLVALPASTQFKGIVLSANATKYVSCEDLPIMQSAGICVLDCSWNQIEKVTKRYQHERKLPYLVAANTINYGKPYKLNDAEALAAALFITGYEDQALNLLESFQWGPNFIVINEDTFLAYSECETYEQLLEAEKKYLQNIKEEQQNKKKNYEIMPDYNSSSEEEEQDDENDEKSNDEPNQNLDNKNDNNEIQTADQK